MESGLYKAVFQTPAGAGYGVVYFSDGKVRGGDSSMFYTGTYSISGNEISASLLVDTHSTSPGMGSVMGVSKFNLDLNGSFSGGTATIKGSSPQAPGVPFATQLTRIAD